MFKLSKSSGQALLIILLIMTVALTIGLSIASRSITDVRISEQSEEAARAFSAAEAGIEEALVAAPGSQLLTGELETTKYTTKIVGLDSGSEFIFPQKISSNEAKSFWFMKNNDDGTREPFFNGDKLQVFWGDSDVPIASNETPALEVVIYYLDNSSYKTAVFTLDPYTGRSPDSSFCHPSSSCERVDSFSVGNQEIAGENLKFNAVLNLSDFVGAGKTLSFARLRMFYSPTPQFLGLKANDGGSFPSQGKKIDSVGQAGSSTRKVEVVRFYPAPPDVFDFLLYSEGGLTK